MSREERLGGSGVHCTSEPLLLVILDFIEAFDSIELQIVLCDRGRARLSRIFFENIFYFFGNNL